MSLIALSLLLASFVNASPAPQRRATYSSSAKAGLSWTDTSVDISPFISSKVSWYYNWGPTPAYPLAAVDGLEYVPMFWGTKSIDAFNSNVPGLVTGGNVSHILGFNEPQDPGQSQLSPSNASSLWTTYIQPLKSLTNGSNLKLGSPAPSNAPSAKQWLTDFIGNCTAATTPCTIDFIALHWYYINATQFIDYLTDMHNTFQKPIWVTEWACENFADSKTQCSKDEISSFMNITQSFMDSTDWVERYAWFGAFKSLPTGLNPGLALMDSSGKISDLGAQYVGSKPSSSGSGSGSGSSSGSGSGSGSGTGSGTVSATPRGITTSMVALAIGMVFSGIMVTVV